MKYLLNNDKYIELAEIIRDSRGASDNPTIQLDYNYKTTFNI